MDLGQSRGPWRLNSIFLRSHQLTRFDCFANLVLEDFED